MIQIITVFYAIFVFLTVGWLVVLPFDQLVGALDRIFLTWFIVSVWYVLFHVKKIVGLMAPSSIGFFFLGLSSVLGSLYVPQDFIAPQYAHIFFTISNDAFLKANVFLILSLSIFAMIAARTNSKLHFENFKSIKFSPSGNSLAMVVIALIILVGSLSIQSNLLFGFRFGLLIIIFYYGLSLPIWLNIPASLLSLLVMVTASFQNKREIIMCVLLLIFIQQLKRKTNFQISVRVFFLFLIGLSSFIFLILWASLLRGYGGFEFTNPIQAILFIKAYVSSSYFLFSFLENLEVTHTYPAAIMAVAFIVDGQLSLLGGSTLAKILFLPFPRDIITFKPDSIIHIYTRAVDPNYWNNGGSLPATLPGEVFINFSWFGLPILFLIVRLFDKVYSVAVTMTALNYKIFAGIALCNLAFISIRGSGFDLLIVTVSLALSTYFLMHSIKLLLSKGS